MNHNFNADGLRGIAAINVAIAHFIGAFYPSLLYKNYPSMTEAKIDTNFFYELLQSPIINIFYNGHFAVLVFFILSGYVLTIPAYNNNTLSLKKRLMGRYFRLNIPIAATIIISFVLLNLNLYYNIEASNISGSTKWFATFFNDEKTFFELIKMISYDSIIYKNSYLNTPLWTISMEFIGSIFLLIFYIMKPKNVSKAFEIILLIIIFVLLYIFFKGESIYYYAIFIGALLNLIKDLSRTKILIFMVLGVYFGGFQFDNIIYNYLPDIKYNSITIFNKITFYNAIGAFFIVTSVINGFGKKVLSSKSGQFLGEISFSLYLLHFLVLSSISSYIYINLPNTLPFLLINFILYIIFVLVLSKYFTKYIDQFAINISHSFSKYFFPSNKKI